jgi:hypothetical protein
MPVTPKSWLATAVIPAAPKNSHTEDDVCRDLIKTASTQSSKFWTGC